MRYSISFFFSMFALSHSKIPIILSSSAIYGCSFFFFLHHYFSFYKLLKLTSLQSCLHHNTFLITDTCKINYTYYSFRWSCDIDIHLFLYGLHDTTLYYYWHHACSCTLYRMYFKKIFFLRLQYSLLSK